MLDKALPDAPETMPAGRPHQVLVVIRGGAASPALGEYALGVAERLGLGVLAAYVDTLPRYGDRLSRRERFAAGVAGDAARFGDKARQRGIGFEHVTASGKAAEAVLAIVHGGRRIDFVVCDPAIGIDAVARRCPVPVFGLDVAGGKGERGRSRRMTQQRNPGRLTMSERTRKRNVARTIVFGAAAVALYAAVFTHSDLITSLSAKGGFYAVVPVITVFLFSYVHGSFTGAFWSALGIEASKGAGASKTATAEATKRKDTRATAQINA
ncbi:MAG: universal stress protein [Solidesulfovibrio sp. DCME]|uniref:universal stress protein n=1 Tax=Solidesulfovibrio sp. DCME TaxID=3447380 RepID=UPI003D0C3420